MNEQIEKLEHGLMICEATGTELVHIEKADAERILALLKEQEPVKPIKKDTVEITARYEFDCPCGAPLLIGQPYCADCGRSVKWE